MNVFKCWCKHQSRLKLHRGESIAKFHSIELRNWINFTNSSIFLTSLTLNWLVVRACSPFVPLCQTNCAKSDERSAFAGEVLQRQKWMGTWNGNWAPMEKGTVLLQALPQFYMFRIRRWNIWIGIPLRIKNKNILPTLVEKWPEQNSVCFSIIWLAALSRRFQELIRLRQVSNVR